MKIVIEDGEKKLEINNPELTLDALRRDIVAAMPAARRALAALFGKECTADEAAGMSRDEIHGIACDIHEKTIEIRKELSRACRRDWVMRLNEEIHDLANALCDRA